MGWGFKKGRKFHQDLNSQLQEKRFQCDFNQHTNHYTMELPEKWAIISSHLYHIPIKSQSHLFASVLFIIVLISKRDVTHATGTEDPDVSRNLYTKFHFNKFSGSAGQTPNHS